MHFPSPFWSEKENKVCGGKLTNEVFWGEVAGNSKIYHFRLTKLVFQQQLEGGHDPERAYFLRDEQEQIAYTGPQVCSGLDKTATKMAI